MTIGRRVEVGAPHLEATERERRRARCRRGRPRARIGWSWENTNAAPGAQHAVDLAEQPVEVLDLVHDAGRQREVDRVGAEEREVGGVALVPLDPDLGRVGELAAERELRRGHVDRDHVRALAGHRDRVLARPAPDVEHPAALDVAAEAEVGLGRAGRRRTAPCRRLVAAPRRDASRSQA